MRIKRSFRIPNRAQLYMIANVDLESIASPGGILRSIDTLVDTLDTSAIEDQYDLESSRGAEPFHPKTLIKVGLYALYNCRFSLRKMEEDTYNHLGYQWLTGNETIDHSTFGKFYAQYPDLITELFFQVVAICAEKDLIDFDVLAIDSVKIRANASYKQFRTLAGIEKEAEKIKTRLGEIIQGALREEKEYAEQEKRTLEKRISKLEDAKKILQERIEKKTEGKSESECRHIIEKEKINITDPDCVLIQQANGEINSGYAVTTATDTKTDVVSCAEVHEGYNDAASLIPAIQASEQNCGQPHKTDTADSGFSSIENLEALKAREQNALIPDKRVEVEERGEIKRGEYDRSNFEYDSEKDEYRCPAGYILALLAMTEINDRKRKIYANKNACSICANRSLCTKGAWRSISRDINEEIKERMRETLKEEENKELYKLRAHSAESPYGNIKHNRKFRIFMRRGRNKVRMEISMLFMLHNILKVR